MRPIGSAAGQARGPRSEQPPLMRDASRRSALRLPGSRIVAARAESPRDRQRRVGRSRRPSCPARSPGWPRRRAAVSGGDPETGFRAVAGSATIRRHRRRVKPGRSAGAGGSRGARGAAGASSSAGGESESLGRSLRMTRWSAGRDDPSSDGRRTSRTATGSPGGAVSLVPAGSGELPLANAKVLAPRRSERGRTLACGRGSSSVAAKGDPQRVRQAVGRPGCAPRQRQAASESRRAWARLGAVGRHWSLWAGGPERERRAGRGSSRYDADGWCVSHVRRGLDRRKRRVLAGRDGGARSGGVGRCVGGTPSHDGDGRRAGHDGRGSGLAWGRRVTGRFGPGLRSGSVRRRVCGSSRHDREGRRPGRPVGRPAPAVEEGDREEDAADVACRRGRVGWSRGPGALPEAVRDAAAGLSVDGTVGAGSAGRCGRARRMPRSRPRLLGSPVVGVPKSSGRRRRGGASGRRCAAARQLQRPRRTLLDRRAPGRRGRRCGDALLFAARQGCRSRARREPGGAGRGIVAEQVLHRPRRVTGDF